MTARATRADADATGGTIPSSAQFIEGIAAVQGVVTQLRIDIKDRFDRVDNRLDGVCSDMEDVKREQAVAVGIAKERANLSESHVLAYRWRVGIAIGAAGGLGGLILGIIRITTGA